MRAFALNLDAALGFPTLLWDERLTTFAAEEAADQAGLRGKKRDQAIDALRGRDRLICEALVATLDVDQIAKVTTYYNAHRPEDAGLLTVGGAS